MTDINDVRARGGRGGDGRKTSLMSPFAHSKKAKAQVAFRSLSLPRWTAAMALCSIFFFLFREIMMRRAFFGGSLPGASAAAGLAPELGHDPNFATLE